EGGAGGGAGDRRRPLPLGGEAADPRDHQGAGPRRQRRGGRVEKDAPLVAEGRLLFHPVPRSPKCCSRRYSALRDRPSARAASVALPPTRASAFWMRKRSASSRVISSTREAASARGRSMR